MMGLTSVAKRRIFVSHDSGQQCNESRAAQSCSCCSQRTRESTRFCRTPRTCLLHLQAPSLSLSSHGAATETPCSSRRRQGFVHGQALAESARQAPWLCSIDGIDLERDCAPRAAFDATSRGRSWLIPCRLNNGGYGWSINSIGYWVKGWFRPMRCSCQTGSSRQHATEEERGGH